MSHVAVPSLRIKPIGEASAAGDEVISSARVGKLASLQIGGTEVISSSRIANFVSLNIGGTEVVTSARAITNVVSVTCSGAGSFGSLSVSGNITTSGTIGTIGSPVSNVYASNVSVSNTLTTGRVDATNVTPARFFIPDDGYVQRHIRFTHDGSGGIELTTSWGGGGDFNFSFGLGSVGHCVQMNPGDSSNPVWLRVDGSLRKVTRESGTGYLIAT